MRQLLKLCLVGAMLLALTLATTALAPEAPVYGYGYANQGALLTLPLGGDLGDIALPAQAECRDEMWSIACMADITWRLADFDTSTQGEQTLLGDVALPDGFYNASSGALPLKQKIYVYGPDEIGPWNSGGGRVLASVMYPGVDSLLILPLGGDVSTLSPMTRAYGNLSEWDIIELELVWDRAGFDAGEPGRQNLQGQVVLPEGYYYYGPQPEQQVIVYDDSQGVELALNTRILPTNNFPSGDGQDALSVFQSRFSINDTGAAALETQLKRWGIKTGNYVFEGGKVEYPITWDLSLVDMNTPGTYYPFTELPGYFELSDIARQGTAVVVQDPNAVDLSGWIMDDFMCVTAQWFKGVAQPEAWVSVDDGEWQPADTLQDEDFWTSPWAPCSFSPDWRDGLHYALYINGIIFPEGHKYEFSVCYEDEGQSVNTLVLDFTQGKHCYPGNGGGPRGGGDREESTQPRPPEDSGGLVHVDPVIPKVSAEAEPTETDTIPPEQTPTELATPPEAPSTDPVDPTDPPEEVLDPAPDATASEGPASGKPTDRPVASTEAAPPVAEAAPSTTEAAEPPASTAPPQPVQTEPATRADTAASGNGAAAQSPAVTPEVPQSRAAQYAAVAAVGAASVGLTLGAWRFVRRRSPR